jgi:16S rRNA (uracil1498-N3)-methyltransferase
MGAPTSTALAVPKKESCAAERRVRAIKVYARATQPGVRIHVVPASPISCEQPSLRRSGGLRIARPWFNTCVYTRSVTARFYAPAAERPGEVIELPSDEAAHLTRVLRLKTGTSVRVFNGRGLEFDGVVDAVANNHVRVRIDEAREVTAAEPRVSVTLAQAVLKGDKMDDVIRDTVMMGATAIQPIVTTRTEVTLAALQRGRRRERWERIAVAAAKQCGRATVPGILDPRPFTDLTTALGHGVLPAPALMLVEPSASGGALSLGELAGSPPREATLVVGPEGGWTPEELDLGSATCRLVTLGTRTLRADATPIIALAALFAVWKEY